ncbi:STAS domain-containing protein [Modestobacter sp. Leaf380]|uniref:STAS domain-containing protein n=1 Tax=Modestobacter sp. Leaf380 TaxID=1736356 RepID=UPI0009EADAEA|nr:STAS domain-containing protein [Modestobacter sp. Leaf380]
MSRSPRPDQRWNEDIINSTTTDPADEGRRPFQLTVGEPDTAGDLRVAVSGVLDNYSNPRLPRQLLTALGDAPARLTVDLDDVDFFGSAGITALVEVSKAADAAGKQLRIVATHRVVTGPLEVTGLLDRLRVNEG